MTIPKDNSQLENARRLRKEMTPHERKLWYLFLRKYPVKIYKQRIIGRFIVDFYCFPTEILTRIFVMCANKLTLPFKTGCKTLSVTCGDSSPKGRAKASCNRMHGHEKWSASVSMRSINCYTDTQRNAASLLISGTAVCRFRW